MEARIDYQALEEWCGLEKVQVSQLGAIAGVTGPAISKRKAAGEPMRIEWILAWQNCFGWSYGEICHFFLNGPPPRVQPNERMYTKTDVMNKLSEVLFNE